MDEVLIRINGEVHYPWRAVDEDGNLLNILVQSRREKKAAKKFFRKLLNAPTWDQIGKLGAIAVIRTALNFFLTREMRGNCAGVIHL